MWRPPKLKRMRPIFSSQSLFALFFDVSIFTLTFPKRCGNPLRPAKLKRMRLRCPIFSISQMEVSSSSQMFDIRSMSVNKLFWKVCRYSSNLSEANHFSRVTSAISRPDSVEPGIIICFLEMFELVYFKDELFSSGPICVLFASTKGTCYHVRFYPHSYENVSKKLRHFSGANTFSRITNVEKKGFDCPSDLVWVLKLEKLLVHCFANCNGRHQM